MPQGINLFQSATVTLDSQGNGTVTLGPGIPGVTWNVAGGACIVSSGNSTPTFKVYLNSVGQASYLGGSDTGNNDAFSLGQTIYTGMSLIGVWDAGDPGAIATLTVQGTYDSPG